MINPSLRFELRPVVVPAAFELQTASVAVWDRSRTTRPFLQFAHAGERKKSPAVEDIIDAEGNALATLANIEAISTELVAAIEKIFRQVTKGGNS